MLKSGKGGNGEGVLPAGRSDFADNFTMDRYFY